MIKCYKDDKEILFSPFKYPAGEVAYTIEREPDEIVCWFEGSDDLLLLFMLMEHFPKARIHIPYLPFSREDRRVSKFSSHGLEMFQECLRSISSYRSVVTFDVHSKEGYRNAYNVKPYKQINRALLQSRATSIVLPDEGAAYRLNEFLDVSGYGVKERDTSTGEITSYDLHLNQPLTDKVLVVDDICDGGRTFIELAKLLPPETEKYLYVSHGIFSKGFDELKKYYKHIYTTDSYKGARDNEFVTEYRCL